MTTPVSVWIIFNLAVFALLAADMFLFQRRVGPVSLRQAILSSSFWIAIALLFNLSIYLFPAVYGLPVEERGRHGLDFLAAYLVEESLSMDNLFVFLMLFSFFKVPPEYRHKTLLWGIVGAMAMRAAFILAGVALIERFAWINYLFGAILVYSGLHMAFKHDAEQHPDRNPALVLLRKIVPVTKDYHGDRFFVRIEKRLWATPLFVTLVIIEISDVMFAVDSIPAVLAITHQPFIVYSSNICAILGLRALFFALAGLMGLFRFLHWGLAGILVFIGAKMLLHSVLAITTVVSLGVIAVTLAATIGASFLFPEKEEAS